MAKQKFPKVIHVIEERPANDDAYLAVIEGGVFALADPQPVAVYRLVEVGRVEITKRFIGEKK